MDLANAIIGAGDDEATGLAVVLYGTATGPNTVDVEGGGAQVYPALIPVDVGDWCAVLDQGGDRVIIGPIGSVPFLPTAGGTMSGVLDMGGNAIENAGDITASSTGDATITIEADTDNVDETHNPTLVMKQDGGIVESSMGINSNNETYIKAHTGGDFDHVFRGYETYTPTISGVTLVNGALFGWSFIAFGIVFFYAAYVEGNSDTGSGTIQLGLPENYAAIPIFSGNIFFGNGARHPAGGVQASGNKVSIVTADSSYTSLAELRAGGSSYTAVAIGGQYPLAVA